MHGIIFAELRKYIETRLGPTVWESVTAQAGVDQTFLATSTYPDEQAMRLVSAAGAIAERPVPELLEEFGEFIAPDLLEVYKPLIKPEWSALDLLERTEETIHTVVRIREPGAAPPQLHCTRVSPDEVVVLYRSRRRLCAVAKGIIRGIARHYHERVQVTEETCMHRGASECRIVVRRV
jgi:predicted hydrocarbon binding protein